MHCQLAAESLKQFIQPLIDTTNACMPIISLLLAIWAIRLGSVSYRFARSSQERFDHQFSRVEKQGRDLDNLLKAVGEKVHNTREVMDATRNHVSRVKEMIIDAQQERKNPLKDFGEVLAYTYKTAFEISESDDVYFANFSAQFGATHAKNDAIRASFFNTMRGLLDPRFSRWPNNSRSDFESIIESADDPEQKFIKCVQRFRARLGVLASQSSGFNLALLHEQSFQEQFIGELLKVQNVYGGDYGWLQDQKAQSDLWDSEQRARAELRGRIATSATDGRQCVISEVPDVPIQFLLGRRHEDIDEEEAEYTSVMFFVGSKDLAHASESPVLGIYTRMRRFAEVQMHLYRWMITNAGIGSSEPRPMAERPTQLSTLE